MSAMPDQPLSLLRRLLRLGANHPRSMLLLVVVISLLAMPGAQRLVPDTGMQRLIDADSLDRQTYLHIVREFGSDRRNFIYLRDQQLWTPERLQTLRRLHDGLRQLPFVERVESVFSTPTLQFDGERWLAQPVLPGVPVDAEAVSAARQRALTDPLATRHLVSADGNALAIDVAVREGTTLHEKEMYAAIEALLTPQRSQFETLVQIGPARLGQEIHAALWHDVRLLLPAFMVVSWCLIYLFTRSPLAATLPLLIGAMSLLWSAGALGYAGRPVGVLAILLPLLAILPGTMQGLRMAAGAYAGMGGDALKPQQPAERRRATEFMVRDLGLPLLLSLLLLSIGFVCLIVMHDTQALRDFAVAALLVVLASGVLTLLLAPALHALFAAVLVRHGRFPGGDLLQGGVALLRRRSVRWSLLALMLLGIGVFVRESPDFALANDPFAAFGPEQALIGDAARLQADLAGPQVFYVMLDSNVEGGFRDPANLRRLAEIQSFIAKQQVFDRSHSLADLVSQANQIAAGGRSEAYQIPATRQRVIQYLMPHAPRDLEPYISHDWRRANIVVRHNLRDSSQLNHHVGELRQAVANYAGPAMVTAVIGKNLLVNAAAAHFPAVQGMLGLILLACVGSIVTLMFTSLRGGLAALVPGLLPLALMLGAMQWLQIPFSAATLIITIVVISIAMESSVHLFSRYSTLARTMSDTQAAVLETVRREAGPLLAIHLTLAAGCLTLLASDLLPIARFGLLAGVSLLLSALVNLLLLPQWLSQVRLIGLYEILAMPVQREALEASPLFQDMSDFQIRKTILISELVEVRAGERLITQGSIGRSMYVVVSGRLEVVRHGSQGDQLQAQIGPGEVIGEIGFVRATRRVADVHAVEASTVLRFDYARMKRDLAYFPFLMNQLNFNISGILGKRLAEVVELQTDKVAASAVSPGPTITEARDT